MARKLRPHEELAFFQAAPAIELTFGQESCRARQQPRIMPDRSGHPSSEPLPEEPNWDECSWPDEWGW